MSLTADVDEKPEWSVVIPYYNERDYLPATLQSLLGQSERRFRLFLVDNASTDGTREVIEDVCRALGARGVEVVHLQESTPGQVHALKKGIDAADTALIATCDADTFYPPQYLEQAGKLFAQGGPRVVAVMAAGVRPPPGSFAGRFSRLKCLFMGSLLGKQCHTGGFAHAFRTQVLKECGGYDEALWPYVLYDHEVVHRVVKHGIARYAFAHWCRASTRRAVHTNTRWTLFERFLYHTTPFAIKDWFFYSYLAKQFAARGLGGVNIRTQPWKTTAAEV